MTERFVAIVGPNASGKSSLGIALARRFNGEIISADSRQVYRGIDIGSGKATRAQQRSVPHHLLDVVDPRRTFTVAQFQRLAQRSVRDIVHRGKLPIVVGGSGLYVQAIIDNVSFPAVRPNAALRRRLRGWPTDRLFRELQRLDPRRAATIDRHNPRRLVRAIEIARSVGRVPKLAHTSHPHRDVLLIGLNPPDAALRLNITKRLSLRLRRGLIDEVKRLKRLGVSRHRLDDLGLEYRFVNAFLEGRLSRPDMVKQLGRAIWQFARRQRTWFKCDRRIHWIDSTAQATRLVRAFLR